MNERSELPFADAVPEAAVPPREGVAPGSTNGPVTLRDRVQALRLPDQSATGLGGTWLPWTLCCLFAFSTLVFALRANRAAPKTEVDKAAPAATDTIASSGDVVLESKGYIIPAHQIQVSPKVSGIVEELYIEEGKKVKAGDTLAVLEKTNYQFAVDRGDAMLQSAKFALKEAEAQREQLYLDWKRNNSLKTGNALAARDFEQADSAYKAIERRLSKLKADVRQADAELATAQWNLDNCTVKAPVAGTILTKKAEKGNIVNPIAFNISASLCDMADLADLEVDMTIQERDIAGVFVGQKCRVRPEAFQERVYEGTVSRLMPIADRAKGAIPVRVKLKVPAQEEGVYLKPEMGVIVSFLKK